MKTLESLYSPRRLAVLLVIILAIVIPYIITAKYWFYFIILICIWTIVAISVNLIFGYTGQLSFAQGGFFGMGAYTVGLLVVKGGWNFWAAFPVAVIVAALTGVLIGIPSLKVRGPYFVIATLGFNMILYTVAVNWISFTEGFNGLSGIVIDSIGPLNFDLLTSQYYLILFFLLIILLVMYRIINSLVGRTYIAIRENEDLAESIGVNGFLNKLMSFVISAGIAGVAGALYAGLVGTISPEVTFFLRGCEALTYVVIGGFGTTLGPIIGTMVVMMIPELFQVVPELRLMLYGLFLVVAIVFMPAGLVGQFRLLWPRLIRLVRKEGLYAG
jgi:branched-chain amino acid transport system permease protein